MVCMQARPKVKFIRNGNFGSFEIPILAILCQLEIGILAFKLFQNLNSGIFCHFRIGYKAFLPVLKL